MKRWILTLTLSLISSMSIFACGFYPMSEDIRFNLLNPNYLGTNEYSYFNYTTSIYFFDEMPNHWDVSSENVKSWFDYFQGKFQQEDIRSFINSAGIRKLKKKKQLNSFETALLTKEYKEVYDYFVFADKLTHLNAWSNDPWELKKDKNTTKRNTKIKQAVSLANKTQNLELKQRYAYLAIRLAYYNHQDEKVTQIYQAFFENREMTSPVDYWALHFYTYSMDETPRKYVEIAKVFSNSSEKRLAAELHFNNQFSKDEILNACLNEQERQDVSFYFLCKQLDDASVSIKAYAKSTNDETRLLFLMLREVNKLEDWILTPYYNEFTPSFRNDGWNDSIYLVERERIREDRQRALNFVNWMKKVHFKDANLEDWRISMEAYLYFLAEARNNYEPYFYHLQLQYEDENLNHFNSMVLALMKINQMKNPNLDDPVIQSIIQKENRINNYHFLFALGRELEYKGNTTDAAYLFSYVNKENSDSWWTKDVYWRTSKLHRTWYGNDFYIDYFFYLDAQYTPEQMILLLEDVQKPSENQFDNWKKENIRLNFSRIQDLLGTKYMRLNQLSNAYDVFKTIDDSLWKSFPYETYLDANPFYTDFFNEHRRTVGDTIRYTKPQLVKQLMSYLDKLDETKGKEKTFYCFQVANCYLNMTYYGNSWLMKRYYWSSSMHDTGLDDDLEVAQANLAKKYYLMASEAAPTDELTSFSLRMAARCEYYKQLSEIDWDAYWDAYFKDEKYPYPVLENNTYSKLVQQKYPKHYDDLFSNCYSFTEYYNHLKN